MAAYKRYSRRRDLRRHAASVLAATVAAALLADRLLSLPPAFALPSAAGLALLGAAVFPLASLGLHREAQWLWSAAPHPGRAAALAALIAGTLLAAGLLAAALTPLALVFPVGLGGYALLLPATAVAFAGAALAAALVPWQSERIFEQMAAFAVLAAATAGGWAVVSVALRAGASIGIGELPAVALAVCAFVLSAYVVSALLAARENVT